MSIEKMVLVKPVWQRAVDACIKMQKDQFTHALERQINHIIYFCDQSITPGMPSHMRTFLKNQRLFYSTLAGRLHVYNNRNGRAKKDEDDVELRQQANIETEQEN